MGEHHYEVAQRGIHILQKTKELQDLIAILGMDELSEEDKVGDQLWSGVRDQPDQHGETLSLIKIQKKKKKKKKILNF